MQLAPPCEQRPERSVSILIRSEDRMQLPVRIGGGGRGRVSILIRSEDRMQHWLVATTPPSARFQSSSGPRTGCNGARIMMTHLHEEFQSSSGPRTGCNADAYLSRLHHAVSILIRSEDRMQLS